jgi:predicted ATP-grasp superfamily ATP-dependent carboligase
MIIQNELTGPDWSVDFVAHAGMVYGIVPKIRTRAHGASTIARIEPNRAIEGLVRGLAQYTNVSGLMNVQVRADQRGQLCIYDFNPRVGASAILGVHAGVDLLALEIARQEGRPLDPLGAPEPCTVWRYYQEYRESNA